MAKMKPRLFPKLKLEDIIAQNPHLQLEMDTVDALRAKHDQAVRFKEKFARSIRAARQRVNLEARLEESTKHVENVNWTKEGF